MAGGTLSTQAWSPRDRKMFTKITAEVGGGVAGRTLFWRFVLCQQCKHGIFHIDFISG